MRTIIDIGALLCIAVAMGLSLAHALELPGKRRLDRETYTSVQAIYYPGFTFGGLVGELGGIVLLIAALLLQPGGTAGFWWIVAALVLLVAVHGAYWVFTHPVNNFWLRDVTRNRAAAIFFATHAGAGSDWQLLRNRWEGSHVVRAVLAILSLLVLAVALTR